MSNLVAFLIRDNMDYSNQVNLSEKLIRYCLKNKKGVIFNFIGYSETLIKKINPNFYFSVSDDFIQLNSEYMTTSDIKNIKNATGKEEFIKKFSFLNDIYQILVDFDIRDFLLIINCDGCESTDIRDFNIKHIDIDTLNLIDILYDYVVNNISYACDFSNLILLNQAKPSNYIIKSHLN